MPVYLRSNSNGKSNVISGENLIDPDIGSGLIVIFLIPLKELGLIVKDVWIEIKLPPGSVKTVSKVISPPTEPSISLFATKTSSKSSKSIPTIKSNIR